MEAVRRRKVLAAVVVASVISAVTLASGALPASLPCRDAHVSLALKVFSDLDEFSNVN